MSGVKTSAPVKTTSPSPTSQAITVQNQGPDDPTFQTVTYIRLILGMDISLQFWAGLYNAWSILQEKSL